MQQVLLREALLLKSVYTDLNKRDKELTVVSNLEYLTL